MIFAGAGYDKEAFDKQIEEIKQEVLNPGGQAKPYVMA